MKDYLVFRTIKSEKYRFFSCCIPKDLQSLFNNRSKFYLSINSVTNRQARLLCQSLNRITSELFAEIRAGMKSLTIEEIKKILRIEIRKQVLWAHHVDEGTSEHDLQKKMKGLSTMSEQEQSLLRKIAEDEKNYDKRLDDKIISILQSLDIDSSTKSVEYKQLRRHFKSLYLLRYDWARSLIKKSGRSDEDFSREADEMLSLNLFENEQPRIIQKNEERIYQREEVSNQSSLIEAKYSDDYSDSLEFTPLMTVINAFLDEKNYENEKTAEKAERAIKTLHESFGNVPISDINSVKVNLFKKQLRQLPTRRKQLERFRNKSFHKLVEMGENGLIKDKEKLTLTSINDTIGYLATFFKWTTQNGYTGRNFFEGVKISVGKKRHVRDERARYSDKQIAMLFKAENYLKYTIRKNNIAYYWVPLIGLFSGCRINEICGLYLDNVIKLKGKETGRDIWCFNLLEESNRPDKRLKTASSRRFVPIHDEILNLDFLDYWKILKRKRRDRLFEELNVRKGHNYSNSVQKFWNERYTRDMGIETDAEGKRVTFHSLRHSVVDTLKQANVDTKFINEHQGHSQGNIDLDRYGKHYDAEILYENCTKRIVYESSRGRKIDFSGLKVDWGIIREC